MTEDKDKKIDDGDKIDDGGGTGAKSFSEDEVSRIVRERLARDRETRAKELADKLGGDPEEIAKKAKRLDEIEEQNKSELDKANAKIDELKAALAKKDGEIAEIKLGETRRNLIAESGLDPAVWSKFISASDEDTIRQQIEDLKAALPPANQEPAPIGNPPIAPAGGANSSPDYDEASRMTVAEYAEKRRSGQLT